MLKHSILY